MTDFEKNPVLIEKKSMEIITGLLGEVNFAPHELNVVKRVIHTTADFEYAQIMEFHHQPLQAVAEALRGGCHVVTDTQMALAGINKKILAPLGVEVKCFMADEEVALEAKKRGVTRAMVSMEHAARDSRNRIYVIGNAPTALTTLVKMAQSGEILPAAIIGVPVGFVGAAESKEVLAELSVPHILTRGRKGGSNVAAAIVNAISYTFLRK